MGLQLIRGTTLGTRALFKLAGLVVCSSAFLLIGSAKTAAYSKILTFSEGEDATSGFDTIFLFKPADKLVRVIILTALRFGRFGSTRERCPI